MSWLTLAAAAPRISARTSPGYSRAAALAAAVEADATCKALAAELSVEDGLRTREHAASQRRLQIGDSEALAKQAMDAVQIVGLESQTLHFGGFSCRLGLESQALLFGGLSYFRGLESQTLLLSGLRRGLGF